MSYLVLFCSCVFQSFEHCNYLAWGKERANLSEFRTFVRFVLVSICRFSLPLGVWEGLRFVIVALPGLFSCLFFICCICFVVIFSSSLLLMYLGKALFCDCGILLYPHLYKFCIVLHEMLYVY